MKMEKYWSRFADDLAKRQTYVVGVELIAETQNKLKDQRSLGSVLELGCGSGLYTSVLLDHSESIVATDYSREMVEVSRNVFRNEARVRVEQADCCDTKYDDCSFDTVFMANLIHIIPEPRQALKEAYRLLKPGGILLLTCFTIEKMSLVEKIAMLYRYRKTFGPLPKGRTPFFVKTLSRMVADVGFSVVEAGLLGMTTKTIFLKARKA